MESTKISAKSQDSTQDEFYIPSQAYLTALMQIFPAIFQQIQKRFRTYTSILLNIMFVFLPILQI